MPLPAPPAPSGGATGPQLAAGWLFGCRSPRTRAACSADLRR